MKPRYDFNITFTCSSPDGIASPCVLLLLHILTIYLLMLTAKHQTFKHGVLFIKGMYYNKIKDFGRL